jgi:hypothetical protein
VIHRHAVVAFAIGFSAVASGARASNEGACGRTERPWIRADTQEAPPALAGFVSLLAAELASRGFDLCASDDGSSPPVATVRVTSRPSGVELTVEVRDAVTDKQVRRDIALGGIPADGRPLTVALAADELLRASWAELALRTATPPLGPVPDPVSLTLRESLPSAAPRERIVQLGVDFAWEHYVHGMTLYGADAQVMATVRPRVELGLQFGLREGQAAAAVDGTVQPSAWSTAALALFRITPLDSRWGLDIAASAGVERLTLAPSPTAGATGSEQSAYALLVGLGPHGSFAILPALRLGAQAIALAPIRGVDAEDASTRFVGLSGFGWAVQIGVSSTP